jgi:hypothetical protein
MVHGTVFKDKSIMQATKISYYDGRLYQSPQNTTYPDSYYTMMSKPAPYYIMNIKGFAKENNFWSTSSTVYLPKGDGCYFTSKKITTLVKIDNADNKTFQNIEISYVQGLDADLEADCYAEPNLTPVIWSANAQSINLLNCKFSYCNPVCFIGDSGIKTGGIVVNQCEFKNLGSGAIQITGSKLKSYQK